MASVAHLAQVFVASEFRSDLWGHLEAAMASEATIVAILGNMHIDARVIEVACIKSEVKFDFGYHWGCLEVTMASEATKLIVLGKQQQLAQ